LGFLWFIDASGDPALPLHSVLQPIGAAECVVVEEVAPASPERRPERPLHSGVTAGRLDPDICCSSKCFELLGELDADLAGSIPLRT
jgi:hypothetical protein